MRTDSTIPAILIGDTDPNGMITFGISSGLPSTTATLASKFAMGCMLEDSTTGLTWQNVGSIAVPNWNDMSQYRTVSVTLTAAQLKALRATPVIIVPAVSGKFACLISAELVYTFTTNAYVITAPGDDFAFRYNNGAGSILSGSVLSTGFIDQAASQIQTVDLLSGVITSVSNGSNAPIVIHNIGGAEWTSATGGTVRVNVAFRYV